MTIEIPLTQGYVTRIDDADRVVVGGRKWTALDTVWAYLFRIERILTHPGAVESAIRARMRRS